MKEEITCKDCGNKFFINENEETVGRTPCPKCGSENRIINIQVVEDVVVKTSIDTVLIKTFPANVRLETFPSLLLKSTIIPEGKAKAGTLIKAVDIPWFKIIAELEKDPSRAFEIPYDRWEEIIAGAYKESGFDEVILTPRSGDRGRDVIATIKGIGSIKVIDSVKAYKPDHLVEYDDIRALMGVLTADKASKGYLTTTSDFPPKLLEDELITEFIPHKLELINGEKLLDRLKELAIDK